MSTSRPLPAKTVPAICALVALAADRRVIAVDARGHGKSEKPHDPARYGPRMADDVVEVMSALGIQRAHVHGFSMGGSILTQILINHPERVVSARHTARRTTTPSTRRRWNASCGRTTRGTEADHPHARRVRSPHRDEATM